MRAAGRRALAIVIGLTFWVVIAGGSTALAQDATASDRGPVDAVLADARSEAGVQDAAAPDAPAPDAAPQDAATRDAAAPDAPAPDAALQDAAAPDAAAQDAAALDASQAPDAAPQDAVAPDASPPTDAGTPADARAPADAGTPVDLGTSTDAGTPADSGPSNPDSGAQADPRASTGEWGPSQSWPIVAIDVSVLPNRQVLAWPRNNDQQAMTWDPASNVFTAVPNQTTDLFCTSHSFMPDGRLLVTGGRGYDDGVGLSDTNIFDFHDGSWRLQAPMNAGRWYPTEVTLSNGNVLVVGGSIDNVVGINLVPEVFSSTAAAWRDLTGAQRELSLYPWLFLAPNGLVFVAGPDDATGYYNTSGAGQWIDVATTNFGYRDYGTAVLYSDSKVFIAGGHDPPTATAEVIDLSDPNPAWRYVAPMAFPRRQLNSVLLPDGSVLVLGGTSSPGFNDATQPVLAVEMWNPVTESWSLVASQAETRIYHSTAWLMPDGRVVSAGGGQPAGDNAPDSDHLTAQIFSPPYLFKGPRPQITGAPSSVIHGAPFVVSTPDAIASVSLIRISSVTHGFNTGQRIVRATFAPIDGGIRVSAPEDPRRCPPGHYLLFLLNAQGVPSEGAIIQIQ